MTKKTKEQLEKERSVAGDRRDWDAADRADAELEKLDTDPAPPKDAEDGVRKDGADVFGVSPEENERRMLELQEKVRAAEAERAEKQGAENLRAAIASGELGPRPPRAPMPRGPFVRYHETEERSCLAIVTAVHEDGSVNLHVFPDGPRTNYLQKVAHGYDAGCWEDYL